MRRPASTIAIALLAVGAVGGFAHGVRSMHKGDRHRRAAEICVDEALREAGHRHAVSSYVDGEHGPRHWEAEVRQLCADEARRQTGGRFAVSSVRGLSERPLASPAELPTLTPNGAETALDGSLRP